MMKKLLPTLLLVSALFVFASPAKAQGLGDVGNVFGQVTQSVKQRFERLYFMLPGEKPGMAVMQQSAAAMNRVESLSMDGTIDVTVNSTQGSPLVFKLALTGPVAFENIYDPTSSQQDLHIVGELQAEGTTMTADVDLKLDGKTMYAKFNQLPALPFFPVADVKDQWLKFDQQSMNTEALDPEAPVEVTPSATPQPLTADQRAQLQRAFFDMMAQSSVSTARKETVRDQKVFVVDATIPDQALLVYLEKTAQINGATAEEISESRASMEQTLASMSDVMITMYINRSSYYLVGFTMPLTLDAGQVQATDAAALTGQNTMLGSGQLGQVSVNVAFWFSDFNEPVEFSLPTDARPAADVFAEALGGAMGGGVGIGAPAMGLPATVTPDEAEQMMQLKLDAMKVKPVELQDLTPEQKKALEEYGIEL